MSTIRDAATVLILRGDRDPEVYWVRRSPSLRFLGGFHTFPGGAVEKTDASVEAGALREVFEEVGVRLEASALEPAGRWLTPPFGPVRFDTRFYVARLPEGAEAKVAPGELESGEWIGSADAIERWTRGDAMLAPPTLHALRCLADGTEGLAARMRAIPAANRGDLVRIEFIRGVFLLPQRTPTLPPATHTNAVVFAGERAIVIDPATPHEDEREKLDALLAQIRGEGIEIGEIVLTHHHVDHVGYAEALGKKLGVPIRAHAETAARLDFATGRPIEDGETWDLGGSPRRRVRAVFTPGHAPGHLALLEEETRTLAAGDLVAGASFIVVDPADGGDMAAYVASLARAKDEGARLLVPAHGPVSAAPAARLGEYVAHRLEREAKIFGAICGGAAEEDAILARAYDDTPQAMWPIAVLSLRAHVGKLEREGKVRRDGGRYVAHSRTTS
jgi:glyoxylase-like metal-dependent hydrolase (beta-lactamase superfamily II)/8-oxo-dGTP pyrophosphatase MutT (NUDIX family)